MLKKIAIGIVAGSLVLAAQVASAEDTQFDIGGGRYVGAAALPFHATGAGLSSDVTASTAAEQRLENTHANVRVTEPAPYNVPAGYFN